MSDPSILHELYEAALAPEGFSRVGSLLAQAIPSSNGVAILRQGLIPIELSATTSREAQRDYFAYYGKLDIWARAALATPDWVVHNSYAHLDQAALLRSEFFVDYARGLGMSHPMGVRCPMEPGLTLSIGVDREQNAQRYTEADERLLVDLLRHLQRALQMRRRLEGTDAHAAAGFAALDLLTFGVVIADAEGRRLFVNAAAEALCRARSGLVLKQGRVQALAPPEARRLAELLRDATGGGTGGAMRISGEAGGTALLALVAPLPRRLHDRARDGSCALLALRRAGDSSVFVERVLTELFGLSRAEAQVMRGLSAGHSLDDLAQSRGVKITTLKTQLEAVFRKTGVENQRDLLRLVGALPQIQWRD